MYAMATGEVSAIETIAALIAFKSEFRMEADEVPIAEFSSGR
jgi:hypothetical protein